jgi:hypothetical protein
VWCAFFDDTPQGLEVLGRVDVHITAEPVAGHLDNVLAPEKPTRPLVAP